MKIFRRLIVVLLCGSLNLLPATVSAQSAQPPDSGVTREMLESRLQQAEASTELAEADRGKLADLYRRAIGLFDQRRSYEAATAEFIDTRESAPRRSAELRRELKKLEARPAPKLPDSLTRKPLAELEQQLLTEKTDLTGLSTRLGEIEGQLEAQAQRAQQIRDRLGEARKRQPEIAAELQLPPAEGEAQRLSEARRLVLEIEARALAAEIEMLEQELLSQPVRIELLGARRDLAALEAGRQSQYADALESLVVERRLSEAESARVEAEKTERRAFGKHPLVQELAQKNTQLGEELNRLAAEIERVTNEENTTASQARRVADNYRLARQKIEIAGLSQALGQALVEQRRGLPDASDFRAAEKRRRQLVVESSLRQIRNQQERARLRDVNAYADEIIAPLGETWKSMVRPEIVKLAEQRRDLIDKAIATDDTYLQALGELDLAQRQLSEAVTNYNRFLDERLLWIRTGQLPSWQLLGSIGQDLGFLFDPGHWRELGRALLMPDTFPWVLLAGLALFGLLIHYRGRLRASLVKSGRNVGQLRHDRYIATARALLLTLVLALPWTILFNALGWHLQFVQNLDPLDFESPLYQAADWSGQFVPAIGAAFSRIAPYVFYFVAFRVFCEADGLAAVHFGWPAETVARLRSESRRLMTVFLPAAFLLVATVTYDPAALAGGLSRLLSILAVGALAWFFGRVLSPESGALREFYLARPRSPLTWLRYLWLGLGIALPLLLAALALIGYTYTATQLGARLVDTVWLIVAIILIHQMVVRWVLLAERRLGFDNALERHRAQRAARDAQAEAEGGTVDAAAAAYAEADIDFGALSEDTKKLINTALALVAAFGLWAIWSDVLPAFRILDEISLWSYSARVEGVDKLVPVTLGDIVLGIAIVTLIVIAARRLPALLEIALLARLRITAGSRYAIATLTQYGIVAIGIVMVFGILGGSWGQIQWLIAALGVGIGFGLQEIVANFICGLILLFERPIRIGDVVTVGDTSGVVTRIRIRSTTIRNWDQKELIVPNKEFITGRLLNWTLSDAMARVVIPVGIAYGSDVGLALKLIGETAAEHEHVVDEPAPLVTFEGFGDSALTLVLRCCIDSMDHRLQTQSELNLEINRKFEDAGIVIAFPQRDIHLDTSRPLDVRLHRADAES